MISKTDSKRRTGENLLFFFMPKKGQCWELSSCFVALFLAGNWVPTEKDKYDLEKEDKVRYCVSLKD